MVEKNILIVNNENDKNIILNEGIITEQEIQKYFICNLNNDEWKSLVIKYLEENNIENVDRNIHFKNNYNIECIIIPTIYIFIKILLLKECILM